MNAQKEFRRFSRFPIQVQFRINEQQSPSNGKLLFDSLNLSAGGAFLRSDFLFEVGTTIEVSFKLPNRDAPLNAQAQVTWVTRNSIKQSEPGMGIKFVRLSAQEQKALEELTKDYQTKMR